MKAAVYYKKNDLRLMDIPIPEVGDGDVLVNIKFCGVCGTDSHIYNGDGGAAPVPESTVIGHEFAGIVAKIGKNVKHIKVGDSVSVNPNQSCGECYFCRNGQEHFCTNMIGYGTTVNGGFAEYVAVPERQVYVVPPDMPLTTASQCETLSCCLNGIDLCNIKPGANVFVIGAGPIGLFMVQLAKLSGAGKLIVSELDEGRRKLALGFGADVAFDPREEDIGDVLAREVPNVDCVIEAAGTKLTTEQAIQYAGKAATVMLFGLVSPETEISIKPFSIFQRELKIVASFINPYTFSRAVQLLASGKIETAGIILSMRPLSEIEDVFANKCYQLNAKMLITMPDPTEEVV